MSQPLVRLTGSPFEQGGEHGQALRERVARNLEIYFYRFQHEARLTREEVLHRAGRYAEAVASQDPAYMEGVRGIAEGSGFPFLELVALNVRYEILYHQFTVNAMADACTAFAIAPDRAATGHLLMGQNWDWIPQVEGAVLHTAEPDGLETLAFTEAGIFGGKIGLNSAGVGLAINGMTTTDDDWSRLRRPFHVRCYEILRSRTFDAAVRVVTGSPRACSTNFLIAQAPDRIVDVEAAPDRAHLLEPEGGLLSHANHFVDPDAAGVTEPPNPRRPSSCARQARLRELLAAAVPVTSEAIQTALRDHQGHPNSLCRHPDPSMPEAQRSITVTSVIMDLDEGTLSLTDRHPCESAFERFQLEHPWRRAATQS